MSLIVSKNYRGARMIEQRWEHGSFFALPTLETKNDVARRFDLPGEQRNYGSGRIALQALIDHGTVHRGWRRLWVPSYYCEDVIEVLEHENLGIARYHQVPGQTGVIPQAVEGDVLLRTSYFGWPVAPIGEWSGEVIDDCSHAPGFLASSKADFAFASLRKCLPIPDGALAWSPCQHSLPPAPKLDAGHDNLALMRLAAMAKKRAYLNGAPLGKESYRGLEVDTEEGFLARPLSRMSAWSWSILAGFDVDQWERQRQLNLEAFVGALGDIDGVRLLDPPAAATPMIAVLQMPNRARRDGLRAELAAASIYTAVLWPPPHDDPEWYGDQERHFAETTLCVHIDGRYTTGDLERVANQIRTLTQAETIRHA